MFASHLLLLAPAGAAQAPGSSDAIAARTTATGDVSDDVAVSGGPLRRMVCTSLATATNWLKPLGI
jgi:hypothetical protein